MSKKDALIETSGTLLTELRGMIAEAREQLVQVANAALTTLYWKIGHRISRDILREKRADYGKQIVASLGRQLAAEYGAGFGEKNLHRMIQFAEAFPDEQILEYAEAIGWSFVPREEAEERRAGFPTRHQPGNGGQECPPSVGGSFLNPYGEIEKTSHHLPHWQQGETWVFVTWRLGDSLPKAKLDQWKAEREAWMKLHPEPWDEKTEAEYHDRFSRQIDEWLDQGSGSCVLKDPACAKSVADALRHFDGERYELASFVVMPNHVHVLFRPLGAHALPEIVKSWKGFTAREINKRTGKAGALWQDEYWDRLIRNERHFFKVVEYIRENPEKAKLRDGQFILESGF